MLSLKEYLFLLFPFTVIFLFIPSQLFYYNSAEWDNDIYLIIIPAIISLVSYLLTLFIIYFVRILHVNTYLKIKLYLPWIFVCIGIFIFLADILAPLQLSQLDGANTKSPEPLYISIIEFIILLFIIILYRKKSEIKNVVQDFVILFIIFSIAYFGFNLYNASKNLHTSNNQTIINKSNKAYTQKLPNIYHLHLDAMQTDYFLRNIKDSNLQNNFTGFTLFKHNITNYPYTFPSVASYLTSTTYTGGKYSKWIKKRDQGLLSDLKDLGYKITIIGKKSVLGANKASLFIADYKIYKEKTKVKHPMQNQFSALLLARILPNFYTNEALVLGERISKFLTSNDKNTNKYPTTIKEGIEPYIGVELLKYIVNHEKDRNSFGEYLLAQPELPHGPYVINKECKYVYLKDKTTSKTASKYMQQVQCATSLVIAFIDTLKKLNRYDNSIIIIHGDHGSGWAGLLENTSNEYHNNLEGKALTPYNRDIHLWSKLHLESRTMALLMIKPAYNNETFKINTTTTDLLDIYPTIAELLTIEKKKTMQGRNLLKALNKNNIKLADKDQFFYYFKPSLSEKENIERITVKFKKDHPIFVNSEKIKKKIIISHLQERKYLFYKDDNINIDGVSGIEKWGRWSKEKNVTMKFKLDKKLCQSKILLLELKAFVTKLNPTQEAVVKLNDKTIGKILLKVGEVQSKIFTLPIEDIIKCGKNNTLKFEIKNPTSPKSVGINNDTRLLGFGFISMEFK